MVWLSLWRFDSLLEVHTVANLCTYYIIKEFVWDQLIVYPCLRLPLTHECESIVSNWIAFSRVLIVPTLTCNATESLRLTIILLVTNWCFYFMMKVCLYSNLYPIYYTPIHETSSTAQLLINTWIRISSSSLVFHVSHAYRNTDTIKVLTSRTVPFFIRLVRQRESYSSINKTFSNLTCLRAEQIRFFISVVTILSIHTMNDRA